MNYPVQLSAQLSQHLRSFRLHRKMTQHQLAQALGLNQPRVAEIEADPGRVSVENLLKVLTALNVQLVLQDRSGPAIEQVGPGLPPGDGEAAAQSRLGIIGEIGRKPSGGRW